MFDVFISHSTENKKIADMVYHYLEGQGLHCFYGTNSVPNGKDYRDAIMDAIAEVKCFVVIYTKESNNSIDVRNEITAAAKASCSIIPFRVDNVEMAPAIAYHLNAINWLDAITPPMEKHIHELYLAICEALAQKPKPKRVRKMKLVLITTLVTLAAALLSFAANVIVEAGINELVSMVQKPIADVKAIVQGIGEEKDDVKIVYVYVTPEPAPAAEDMQQSAVIEEEDALKPEAVAPEIVSPSVTSVPETAESEISALPTMPDCMIATINGVEYEFELWTALVLTDYVRGSKTSESYYFDYIKATYWARNPIGEHIYTLYMAFDANYECGTYDVIADNYALDAGFTLEPDNTNRKYHTSGKDNSAVGSLTISEMNDDWTTYSGYGNAVLTEESGSETIELDVKYFNFTLN